MKNLFSQAEEVIKEQGLETVGRWSNLALSNSSLSLLWCIRLDNENFATFDTGTKKLRIFTQSNDFKIKDF